MLLHFGGSARLLQLLYDALGVRLGNAFLDVRGRRLNEVFRLLQTERRHLANSLDDVDLVRTDVLKDDDELGLLLLDRRRRSSVACGRRRSGSHRHRRGRRDAELVLDLLVEVAQLEDRHLLDDVEHLINLVRALSHCCPPSPFPALLLLVPRFRALLLLAPPLPASPLPVPLRLAPLPTPSPPQALQTAFPPQPLPSRALHPAAPPQGARPLPVLPRPILPLPVLPLLAPPLIS